MDTGSLKFWAFSSVLGRCEKPVAMVMGMSAFFGKRKKKRQAAYIYHLFYMINLVSCSIIIEMRGGHQVATVRTREVACS